AGRGGGGSVGDLVRARVHDANGLFVQSQFTGGDAADVRVYALAHFSPAVVHLRGSIEIKEHQRARLVQVGDREGNAELHRRHGDAALASRMAAVPIGNFRAALREIAGSLQFSPDGRNAIVPNLLAVMGGVGLAAAVIEIALADNFRRQAQPAGDAIDNLFNDQHSLRSAEATESGIRG